MQMIGISNVRGTFEKEMVSVLGRVNRATSETGRVGDRRDPRPNFERSKI
jgi:hypothetical protein